MGSFRNGPSLPFLALSLAKHSRIDRTFGRSRNEPAWANTEAAHSTFSDLENVVRLHQRLDAATRPRNVMAWSTHSGPGKVECRNALLGRPTLPRCCSRATARQSASSYPFCQNSIE